MDIIQKRTGVKYHEVPYLPIASQMGLCTKGSPQKRFVRTATIQEKKKFKKSTKGPNHT